jgi:hypothetical protein
MGGPTMPGIGDVDALVKQRVQAQLHPQTAPNWDDLSETPPPPKNDTSNGQHLSVDHEGLWQRFKDNFDNFNQTSKVGALARWASGFIPAQEDYVGGGDNSQAALQARAQARVAQTERDRREQYAGQSADDPWNPKGGTIWGDALRGAAAFGGNLAAGQFDPITHIVPGGGVVGRVVGVGGLMGADNASTQLIDKAQGVRDDFSPTEALENAALGAGFAGVGEAVGGVRNWWKSRGVDTAHIPDDQLVQASLDGSIGGPDAAAEFGQFMQSTQGMRGANPVMDATINRGANDLYSQLQAERAGQAPPPVNLGDAVAAGIGSKRINQAIDQFQATGAPAPSRVVPPDVAMIAAPEGIVRGDDPGAMVALERQRAANQAVMDQAGQAAPANPTLEHILQADLDTQKKVEVLWDQLHKEPPPGTTPFQASTVAEAGAPRAAPVAPHQEMPWRMSAPEGADINGLYSGRSRPVEGRDRFGAPTEPRTTVGDFEDLSRQSSPTNGQRERGVPADLEAPMGAGGSDRLFKSDVQGDKFWEDRAHSIHQDEFAKAQANLEEEWAQRAAQRGANKRFEEERVRGGDETNADPSNQYRDKYDQKPVKSPTNPDAWHMTKEGYVAGANDRPVAFRNPKEAAKWAASNRMGGDFELHSWKTNSSRIVLRRREGSTYGERPAPSPAEPTAAGPDGQRLIAGPREETPDIASGSETADSSSQGGGVASDHVGSASERTRPIDALTFIARHGGIASETSHNLRKGGREMPQFAPGGGHLFRKGGKSIDEVGELLHEAGYFTGERPTEAEVLDLLHKAEFDRQYRPEDVEAVKAHEASDENAHWEERARDELAHVAAEHDHQLSTRDTNRVLELMASGKTAHEAYREHIEEEISRHLDAMQREAGDQGYDFHDDTIGQNARGGTEGDAGSARVPDDAGERGQAARDARPDGQQDAFGTRPGDERASLERQAEGRSRSDVSQKAPGSDGGLFDGGHDREMFLHGKADASGGGQARLADHLKDLASRLSDPRKADLARRLADLVGDVRVHFNDGSLKPGIRGAARFGEDGALSVHLRSEGDAEVALHEAIHAAVMSRYNELSQSRMDSMHIAALNDLRARALKSYRKGTDVSGIIGHALEDTDEFMAYGMTSPEFQRWLQARGTAGLWQRFVNTVRGLIGLEPKYTSMLDSVMRSGNGLLAEAKHVKPFEGALGAPARERFAHEAIDPEKPGPAGWKRIAGLVFENDMLDHEGPGLVDAVKSVYGNPKSALGKVADRMRAFGEVAAYSADSAARSLAARFDAPTIAKMADLFHAEAGKTDKAIGRTYSEAVSQSTTRYLKELHDALRPFVGKDASLSRIRDMLATPDRPVGATADERAAAVKVRDMLSRLLDYRLDAGEDIGMVRDGYFPRVTRFDKVAANPERFRQAAIKVYKDIGHEAPEEAADALLTNAINGSMNISDAQTFGGGGKPSSSKAREFGKSADEHLRSFYETNPMRALADYIGSATRRAEEARRFGPKGRVGTPERLDWMKANGDRTQWDVMKRQIQAELRAKGSDARGVMERVEKIRGTNLGHMAPGEIKAGAAVSVVHAWNQLGTLGQATFASLPEMAMGFVRGGPVHGFTHLGTTFSEFVRNIRKLPPSDARRYAEAAGAVGSDTAMDLMRARADDPSQHVAVQKVLHQFYRKTGLEQWTDAGRTAAVKTASRFVDALAHDLESSSARTRVRAAGYMRELGVSDPEAFGAYVRKGAPSVDDIRTDKGMAREYATAMLRFANQSVLMPNRAVKPTWASHPLGSLLFALQSYNYAFKKNVIDRVARETKDAVANRDPAKLKAAAGMAVLAGTTALIQGLRHTIYGTPEGQPQETPLHYALETLDRTGVFGAASPLLNAFEGLRYKRSVGNVLLGSVAGRAVQAADAVGGLYTQNSPDTNSAERKAAGAVYDMAVRPAEDAIGASVLRGGLGSALILGTGGKGNGIALNDKNAFQTALAGPEEERDETTKDDENE